MRIAVVVQRFGRDILGGAETHADVVARILARHHDVEVLTSTAGDYQSWAETFAPGPSEEDGLRVRRFAVARGRAPSWETMASFLHDGFLGSDFAGSRLVKQISSLVRWRMRCRSSSWRRARSVGPRGPGLRHDRVLFFTYLYPTTYEGLASAPLGRAFVIPTLHDEAPAYLPVFGRRLSRAELLCSTDAEIALLKRLYPAVALRARRIGYGIPLPPRREHRTTAGAPFLLYAGRIDAQKGIGELVEWYRMLRAAIPGPPSLRLIGEAALPLPSLPGLEVLGFVDEAEKDRLMREAMALVHPSPYESLGIVLLEAMARETPIIVNAASEVMVDHCRRSGAGVWVRDGAELVAATRRFLAEPELGRALGRRGRGYVEAEYAQVTAKRLRFEEPFVDQTTCRATIPEPSSGLGGDMAVHRFPSGGAHPDVRALDRRRESDLSDEEYARTTEVGHVIAPPTFVQASAQFDPDWPLRPKIGEPWFGSGKDPTGARSNPARGGGGGGAGAGLHAEQHFEYHRHLKPGDVLRGVTKEGGRWEKEGRRGGKLQFMELITEFCDQDDQLVITARSVGVRTEKLPDQA
jgi:glycosyltransferase involved in cell wall biosynthesis